MRTDKPACAMQFTQKKFIEAWARAHHQSISALYYVHVHV